MRPVLFFDIEVYANYAVFAFKRHGDGRTVALEMSARKKLNRDGLRRLLEKNTIVTYNGLGYDMPITALALREDTTNEDLKRKSDGIIQGGVPWWKADEFCGVRVPRDWDHIDLKEPQPNAFASLKILNGRLHGRTLKDLPFAPDHRPTHADMDALTTYCLNDLDATERLYEALAEPLALRAALGKEYRQDFRSKSDSQIGETIVKKRAEEITGNRPVWGGMEPGDSFRYRPPTWMRFDRPELRAILDRVRATEFVIKSDGKVNMPAWLSNQTVTIGSSTYALGIGGLHSTESGRALHTTDDAVLVDADVASQYPAIILMLGLAPKSLGDSFLAVYGKIKADRLTAKKRAKAIKILMKAAMGDGEQAKLEAELARCVTTDKGMKISLNGVYGKLGSPHSVLYAPDLMIAVTLTGQLSLLMLIERAEAAGIPVVSGNTDGVLFHCPRPLYGGLDGDRLAPSKLAEIADQWERETGLDLEFGEYASIYNQSVNSYFAIKTNGGHKRKGPLGNPWSRDPNDYDPRALLMKNPQMTVCSDAALARIKSAASIADTIRGCRDIRQFVTVIKVTKGATWRGEYQGKVVRYYWSTRGEEILEAEPHPVTGNFKKVPKTDGCAPCMTLPDELPADIDYDRYVAETEDILKELGFFGDVQPPQKRIRITRANRLKVLLAWLDAA